MLKFNFASIVSQPAQHLHEKREGSESGSTPLTNAWEAQKLTDPTDPEHC